MSNLLSVVVSAVSLLDEGNQENDCEHDAKTTHYDVADSKEVVLSSKGIGGWKHKALLSFEAAHIIVVLNSESVSASSQISCDLTPQLSETGETCCSHPHNKVLYSRLI